MDRHGPRTRRLALPRWIALLGVLALPCLVGCAGRAWEGWAQTAPPIAPVFSVTTPLVDGNTVALGARADADD